MSAVYLANCLVLASDMIIPMTRKLGAVILPVTLKLGNVIIPETLRLGMLSYQGPWSWLT